MDVKLSGIYVPNNTEVKKPVGYRSPGCLTTSWRALQNKEKAGSEREKDWLAKKYLFKRSNSAGTRKDLRNILK